MLINYLSNFHGFVLISLLKCNNLARDFHSHDHVNFQNIIFFLSSFFWIQFKFHILMLSYECSMALCFTHASIYELPDVLSIIMHWFYFVIFKFELIIIQLPHFMVINDFLCKMTLNLLLMKALDVIVTLVAFHRFASIDA